MKSLLGILITFWGALGFSHARLVEYPFPTPKHIELLPAGSTDLVLSNLNFVPTSVKIRVRMFPILSSPPRDPYPAVTNPFLAELTNDGGFSVLSRANGTLLAQGKNIKFDFAKGEYQVDQKTYAVEELEIVPDDPTILSDLLWDKGHELAITTTLNGNFIVMKTSFIKTLLRFKNTIKDNSEVWSIVNELPLNFYLRSVLPSEIMPNWHMEALKVQAVAARTYALYEMAVARVKEKRNWDVDPTTWFQSYRGVYFRRGDRQIKVEDEATNKAVKDSRHHILMYNGEVIKAYFSANSGGVTCSAKECFHLAGDNPPYLVSVPDADGVQKMPYGTWGERANVSRQTVKEKLILLGYPDTTEVDEVMVDKTGESGRVWGLRVKIKNGEDIVLNRLQSSAIMTLFGGIRSYLFQIFSPNQDGKQNIVGHGLGHGVGMSQYGALLFAEQGWDADRILRYYYSGVQLKQIANGDAN
jgi:stage II sporulation protein D